MRLNITAWATLLAVGVSLPAQTTTTYSRRIPKGVTPITSKEVTYETNFRVPHVPQQSILGSLLELAPGGFEPKPKYLIATTESIVGAKHYALPPMERGEIDEHTPYRFEFRYKGEKVDLGESGKSELKPLGAAIKAKMGEAIKFEDQSKFRIIVNVYANDNYFNIGMFDVGVSLGIEAGIFEDRKPFNGLVFNVRHRSSAGKKGEPRSPEILRQLGESIGFDVVTAKDFIPLS